MKKTCVSKTFIRTAAILLLLTLLIITLVSCSKKLSGTYASEGLIAQTFTFKDDNVTMSAFGINISGKYRIEDDKIIITYSLLGKETDWSQSFSKSGNIIIIGGTAFTKQDK